MMMASTGHTTNIPFMAGRRPRGAMFRANLAWDLQNRLGVRMEQYGPNAEFTRIKGMPEDLLGYWSKRRKANRRAGGRARHSRRWATRRVLRG